MSTPLDGRQVRLVADAYSAIYRLECEARQVDHDRAVKLGRSADQAIAALSDLLGDAASADEAMRRELEAIEESLAGGGAIGCTNPGGHVWNRSPAEADEARLAGDVANDNIRCIYCGADGDA